MDSAIAGYTLASDLAIEEAKAHLLAKENDKAAEKIKAAAEIWPTNPKLKEFRTLVSNSSGLVTARNDFDRLLSEGNFREIARRQYEIAPVIQGDATREDAFKQIMTNLTKIEIALGKASEFSKIGQNYAAWEQLADLREQFPDDPKLGRELELLAPKVADFTLALDKATQFEKRTPEANRLRALLVSQGAQHLSAKRSRRRRCQAPRQRDPAGRRQHLVDLDTGEGKLN